jgi:uncharacterized UPF0160 family protein
MFGLTKTNEQINEKVNEKTDEKNKNMSTILPLTIEQHQVITHWEKFHCDEVMGTAMLNYLFDGLSEIIRTRNLEVINKHKASKENKLNGITTYVLDVSMKYNHNEKYYDHHQTTFRDTFNKKNTIPLSSCGLIWKHYGKQIIEKMINDNNFNDKILKIPLSFGLTRDKVINYIYNKFYSTFAISIDGNDNGIEYIDKINTKNLTFNYSSELPLAMIVSMFNNKDVRDHKTQMTQFKKAMNMCQQIFTTYLHNDIDAYLNYKEFEPMFKKDFDARQNDEILIINGSYNANKYLYSYDEKQNIKFLIYPRNETEIGISCVNEKHNRFKQLVQLIDFKTACSLFPNKDAIKFIHKNKFCGSFDTIETAITVAKKSLEYHEHENKISTKIIKFSTNHKSKLISILALTTTIFFGYTRTKK